MEDIRKLLTDQEAEIAPESLAYILRGLNCALADLLRDSAPSDSKERLKYNEMVGALAYSAEIHSIMLARWMGRHVDKCSAMD